MSLVSLLLLASLADLCSVLLHLPVGLTWWWRVEYVKESNTKRREGDNKGFQSTTGRAGQRDGNQKKSRAGREIQQTEFFAKREGNRVWLKARMWVGKQEADREGG